MAAAPQAVAALAALLRSDDAMELPLDATKRELMDACDDHDLAGLVYHRLCRGGRTNGRSGELREALARQVRIAAAAELLRQREITAALDALAAAGVQSILLKGAALAYTVYEHPESRPRDDTDLLIQRAHVDAARHALIAAGYSPAIACDGELLFCQFALDKTDVFGVQHTLDVHWKISTQPAFADALSFEELASEAEPIPALGEHALGPGAIHGLLLACIHPVMHHRNAERLIWTHDIHLLASRLGASEFERLVDLASARHVTAVVRHSLAAAQARFGTAVPDRVMTRLQTSADEPSAAYLRPDRRWHDELLSSVLTLPRWRDRMRLLREVLLPRPAFMFEAYGLSSGPASAVLLPFLYLHRGTRGAWRVVSGRK